jgi:hypothetical protein
MSTFDDFVYDDDVFGGHDPLSLSLSDEEGEPSYDGGEREDGASAQRGPPDCTGGEWAPPETYEEKQGTKPRVCGILEAVLAMDNTDAILQVVKAACLRYHEVDASASASPNWPDLLACQAHAALPGARREIQEWAHRQERD